MEKFLNRMVEVLDTDKVITMNSELNSFEEWDSLSMISFLSMADIEYGKQLVLDNIKPAKTMQDLFNLVNEEK